MDELRFDRLVSRFKAAWHSADAEGQQGHRTEAGVRAVLEDVDEVLGALIDLEAVRIQYDNDQASEFIAVSHLEDFRERLTAGGED